MSSLVYSSSVSLSDAIDTVNHLLSENSFHLHDVASNLESCLDERQILHAAASILRIWERLIYKMRGNRHRLKCLLSTLRNMFNHCYRIF